MKETLKKAIMIVCMALIGCALSVNAEELQEVVYLKNGSVIRGVIVEQIPNKSLKIKTNDGNIFVFEIDQVEKITKEPVRSQNTGAQSGYRVGDGSYTSFQAPVISNKRDDDDDDDDDDNELHGYEKAPRYRGFAGFSFVIYNHDDSSSGLAPFLYTSHGMQINPYLYAGVGFGYCWYDGISYDEEIGTALPLFVHLRTELHNKTKRNFSPYLDIKGGYSVGTVKGGYFSPEMGIHFYFGHSKVGMSIGIGYNLQGARVKKDYSYTDYNYSYGHYSTEYKNYRYSYRTNLNAFNICWSLDF